MYSLSRDSYNTVSHCVLLLNTTDKPVSATPPYHVDTLMREHFKIGYLGISKYLNYLMNYFDII